MIFLLNEDVGYLQPGDPGDAYEQQPVERQAHEAEDEAAEAFEKFADQGIRNARKGCKLLLGEVNERLKTATTDKTLTSGCVECQSALQAAMRGDKAVEIDATTLRVQKKFYALCEEADLQEAGRMVEEMGALREELERQEAQRVRDEKRQEAAALIDRANAAARNVPIMAGAIGVWCSALKTSADNTGRGIEQITRDVNVFRDVVDNQIQAAADLIGEIQAWLNLNPGKDQSVDNYLPGLPPKFARDLAVTVKRLADTFEVTRNQKK
jgi:hypothetical protein